MGCECSSVRVLAWHAQVPAFRTPYPCYTHMNYVCVYRVCKNLKIEVHVTSDYFSGDSFSHHATLKNIFFGIATRHRS